MVDKQKIHLLYHLQGVEELFDDYAETFDDHLQQGLRYDVPNLMRQQIPGDNPHFKRCLDLGCGTGLGGVAFRDCCDHLEGTDLSSRMVKKARALKGVYNVAKHGDLHMYLKKKKESSFDLMISVDVVMYIYDLAPLFRAVKRVLSVDGIFAVSTEALAEDETDGDSNVLERETGRYAHSRRHVLSLAEGGLELQSVKNVLGRMDEDLDLTAKIRWEANTDTITLENVINPTHRHAIQEKTKKRLKEEKAQRKKDDKSKKEKRRQQRRTNDTT